MAKAAAPSPFAAAQRKPTATAKKSDKPIIVASDTTTYDGATYTKAEVVSAIQGYVAGHDLFEQGKAMKDTSRPTIVAFSRTRFAERWLMQGSRPDNPKLVTEAAGSSILMGVSFNDSVKKLDDASYTSFANLVGAANAEKYTLKRDEFSINPDVLDQTVKVVKNGKVIEQNVMAAIAEALQEKFAASPEIIPGLFYITPKFQTTKGLIDKGLELVAPDKSPASAIRLAQFLELGGFTMQLKVGASGGKE